MNRCQKKRNISGLLNEAQLSSNADIAEQKLAEAVLEIYSSGFGYKHLKLVSKTIDTFILDIPYSVFKNTKDEFRIESSKKTLLTLIDLSQLPD